MPAIGIDLGTTNCVVAYQKDSGTVEVISSNVGGKLIPSFVSFTSTNREFGAVAKKKFRSNIKNTVYAVKRLLGREFADKVVQADIKDNNYLYDIVDVDGRAVIEVDYLGSRKQFTPVEISAMLLGHLKKLAEKIVGSVDGAVITVPAYFNDAQRLLTKEAAVVAGIRVLSIINEPTAAALAYGLQMNSVEKNVVLVFDIGGGTFDVTLMELTHGNTVTVLATGGETHLGGEDFDSRLVQYFAKAFNEQENANIFDCEKAILKIRAKVSEEKHILSGSNSTILAVDSLFEGKDFEMTVSRETFEDLCSDLLEKMIVETRNVLEHGSMHARDVDSVVLVGGSSRIPKVQEMLSTEFGSAKVLRNINPDEAVAIGAAVFAASLDDPDNGTCNLHDVTPFSLGLRVFDGSISFIIPRNSSVPTRSTKRFETGYDDQTEVTFPIYEGEHIQHERNTLLASFSIEGIQPRPSGEEKFDVTFEIDAEGVLTVSAENVSSSQRIKKSVTVSERRGTINRQEKRRMIEEEFRHNDLDDAENERLAARHELEKLCRSALKEGESSRESNVCKKISNVLKWVLTNLDKAKDDYVEKKDSVEEMLSSSSEPPQKKAKTS